MKRMALLSIIAVGALLAVGVSWRYYSKRTLQGASVSDPQPSPPPSESIFHSSSSMDIREQKDTTDDKHTDPLFDLSSMIEDFVGASAPKVDAELALLQSRNKWEAFRKSGGTFWKSEQWMRSKEYYQQMNVSDLAHECFSRPVFHFEMAIFDDPRFGVQRLRIMHDGLSELFFRKDLWKAILECYDSAEDEIRYGQPPERIVLKSETLCELSKLFIYLPELREQVKGRERLFVEAQISSLQAYVRYLEETKERNWDEVGLFFREPVVICETALMLVETDDKEAFSRIMSRLGRSTLGRKQDPRELEKYLEEVVTQFQEEYLHH